MLWRCCCRHLPAHRVRPTCNANLFDISLQAIPIATVAGATVNYFVATENASLVNPGCDVTELVATFTCPGPTGAADGASVPVPVPSSLPFPSGIQVFGPFPCVMPDPVSNFAIAKVEGTFNLQTSTPPTPNSFLKTIAVTIQDCLVQVDKQVSCDGGVTWVDQGLVFANEDGTIFCNGVNNVAPAIQVRHQVQNAGQVPLFACVLDDTNNAFDLDPDGVTITSPLVVGGSTGLVLAPGQPLCSDSLDANEPNTASVSCFCTPGQDPDLKTSASDSADINCQSRPELSLTKVCADPAANGTNAITITAQATAADLGFVNCHVTDEIFLDDTTCPADVGIGTTVTVAPADFNLAAGASQIVTGSVGPLTANACNTASISCTVATTGIVVTADDDAVCPGVGEGCFTHTPGFWGNHPAITRQFLNVEVCGVTIDNVGPATALRRLRRYAP